jgi:hypothetical protein
VFIDDAGAVCAVGYLIERSVGRALPERIAQDHRYEFLEDIAAAMPEVGAWVAGSGFTLEELASIQPAYSSPNIEQWKTWDLARHAPKDGPFDDKRVTGTFLNKSLHGTWTVRAERDRDSDKEVIVGRGNLVRGNGTWKSYYKDGKTLLATGPYWNSKANGDWTFYHPSGNVAAKGKSSTVRHMELLLRHGKTPIAMGRFLPVVEHWRVASLRRRRQLSPARTARPATSPITADASGVTERRTRSRIRRGRSTVRATPDPDRARHRASTSNGRWKTSHVRRGWLKLEHAVAVDGGRLQVVGAPQAGREVGQPRLAEQDAVRRVVQAECEGHRVRDADRGRHDGTDVRRAEADRERSRGAARQADRIARGGARAESRLHPRDHSEPGARREAGGEGPARRHRHDVHDRHGRAGRRRIEHDARTLRSAAGRRQRVEERPPGLRAVEHDRPRRMAAHRWPVRSGVPHDGRSLPVGMGGSEPEATGQPLQNNPRRR